MNKSSDKRKLRYKMIVNFLYNMHSSSDDVLMRVDLKYEGRIRTISNKIFDLLLIIKKEEDIENESS